MKRIEPPEHVDVGPHRYQLVLDKAAIDHLSLERARPMNAETDCEQLTITVRPGLPDTVEQESVLHETLHATLSLTGLTDPSGPLGDELEERLVVALAPALLDVMRRNPDLIAFLVA